MSSNPEARLAAAANLDGDAPIRAASDDRFGLAPYATWLAQIVELVSRTPDGAAPVIGLTGSWGSGKTSVYRMAERLMTSDVPVDGAAFAIGALDAAGIEAKRYQWRRGPPNLTGYRFIVFESWSAEDTSVAYALYDLLWRSLQEDDPAWLKKYARASLRFFRRRPARFGAMLGAVTQLAEAAAGGDADAADMKAGGLADPGNELDMLTAAMSDAKRHIVLVLDDLDRLTPERATVQIAALWWLRALPNLTMILIYDDARLVRALELGMFTGSEDTAEDARTFLEKVVQVTVDLPAIPPSRLVADFEDRLLGALGRDRRWLKDGDRFGDRPRWDVLREVLLEPHLTTPRSVTRLLNAVIAGRLMLRENGVDLRDFVGAQALRLFCPERFSALLARADMAPDILTVIAPGGPGMDLAVLLPHLHALVDAPDEPVEEEAAVLVRGGLHAFGQIDRALRFISSDGAAGRFDLASIMQGDETAVDRLAVEVGGAPRPMRAARDLADAVEAMLARFPDQDLEDVMADVLRVVASRLHGGGAATADAAGSLTRLADRLAARA